MKRGQMLIERLIMYSEVLFRAQKDLLNNSTYITAEEEQWYFERGIKAKKTVLRIIETKHHLSETSKKLLCLAGHKESEGKFIDDIRESNNNGYFTITSEDLEKCYKLLHYKKCKDNWHPCYMLLLSSKQIISTKRFKFKELKNRQDMEQSLKKLGHAK